MGPFSPAGIRNPGAWRLGITLATLQAGVGRVGWGPVSSSPRLSLQAFLMGTYTGAAGG